MKFRNTIAIAQAALVISRAIGKAGGIVSRRVGLFVLEKILRAKRVDPGGIVSKGGPEIVGEKNPEVVIPDKKKGPVLKVTWHLYKDRTHTYCGENPAGVWTSNFALVTCRFCRKGYNEYRDNIRTNWK